MFWKSNDGEEFAMSKSEGGDMFLFCNRDPVSFTERWWGGRGSERGDGVRFAYALADPSVQGMSFGEAGEDEPGCCCFCCRCCWL
jgi:hypothetical protein